MMFKRAYTWAMLLGLMAVLLAAIALLYTLATDNSEAVHQRLQVQEAVARLASSTGCLTCHTTLDYASAADEELTPILYAVQAPDYSPLADAHLATEFYGRLLNMGERILAVQPTETGYYHSTVNEFLRIYQQSRNQPNIVVMLRLNQEADKLERLIFLLEHHTQPYQWREVPQLPGHDPVTLALQILPSPTPVTISRSINLYHPSGETNSLQDDGLFFVPSRMAVVCDRAGPPAGVDSVWI